MTEPAPHWTQGILHKEGAFVNFHQVWVKVNLPFHPSFSFCSCDLSRWNGLWACWENSLYDHFWPQKSSELLHELNVPLGNSIRCFLSWLPKQNEKLGAWQKCARLEQGKQELGEGKAQNRVFAVSCIIAALRVSICHRNSGCRDGGFRFSKAHYISKSSGEMSQQDCDVITTRKCIFKKMGPWLNRVHQGISLQKASLITFLKSLLHFQLYKNGVITVFNYLLAPTWLMSFTPIALWTVGEKRWSGSTL